MSLIALLLALAAPPQDAVARVIEERAAELKRNPVTHEAAERIAGAVVASSERHHIPVPLLLAIIEVESAYGVGERSTARCRGLMQLNPRVARAFAKLAGLKRWSIDKIEDNIEMGAAYLRSLLDRYGRVAWAVSSYNRGQTLFERQGRPVGKYARAVLGKLGLLTKALAAAPAAVTR